MKTPTMPLAMLVALGIATAGLAQEAGQQPPPTENPMAGAVAPDVLTLGEPVPDEDGPGTAYLAATNGDWEVRCIRVPDDTDPCQMYQRLFTEDGEAVAEIVLFNLPPDAGEAVAAAEIVTPLGTILTQQIAMTVDGGQVKRYPFRFCDPVGCVAQIGLTQADIQAFRRGAVANMVIAHLSIEEPFNVPISLIGFTASYDQVVASNQF